MNTGETQISKNLERFSIRVSSVFHPCFIRVSSVLICG
jgi:hypothetical protein